MLHQRILQTAEVAKLSGRALDDPPPATPPQFPAVLMGRSLVIPSSVRFDAMHPREEPYAGMPHV